MAFLGRREAWEASNALVSELTTKPQGPEPCGADTRTDVQTNGLEQPRNKPADVRSVTLCRGPGSLAGGGQPLQQAVLGKLGVTGRRKTPDPRPAPHTESSSDPKRTSSRRCRAELPDPGCGPRGRAQQESLPPVSAGPPGGRCSRSPAGSAPTCVQWGRGLGPRDVPPQPADAPQPAGAQGKQPAAEPTSSA